MLSFLCSSISLLSSYDVSISKEFPKFRKRLLPPFQSLRVEEAYCGLEISQYYESTGDWSNEPAFSVRPAPFHSYDEIFKASILSSNVHVLYTVSFSHFSISDSLHSLIASYSLVPD